MYNKEGKIKLETSAKYVPIGKTNISFYDSDIGTADLVFYITRNQQPLEVSNENVDCHIVLVANDGSYIVDNATIVDPLNGKAKFTIPTEFLSHTGEVKGQVFIAVHGVDDMVTEVEFTFNIQSSLVSTVPAVDKLNYIKTFDDLKQTIVERVQYIEDAIANGEDYVTQLDTTFNSHMTSINNRFAEIQQSINTDFTNLGDNLLALVDGFKTELSDQYSQYSTDMNNIKQEVVDISESLVTKDSVAEEIQNKLDAIHFQKYSLTEEDGKRKFLGMLGTEESGYNSVLELPPGFYDCHIPGDAWTVDAPQSSSGRDHIVAIDVYEGTDKRKQIRLVQNLSNFEYRATVHTATEEFPNGRFMGWKRSMDANDFDAMNSDTGWIRWSPKGGATERELNIPNTLQNMYRVIKVNGVSTLHLRVNLNNITSKMNIGSIPAQYVPKFQNFYVRTPVTMNPAVLSFDSADGNLWVYLNTNDIDKWLPGHYIIGEVSYIIDDTGIGV